MVFYLEEKPESKIENKEKKIIDILEQTQELLEQNVVNLVEPKEEKIRLSQQVEKQQLLALILKIHSSLYF